MLNAEAIFRQMPTLETRRLLLRPLCLEDAKDMYDYACDHGFPVCALGDPQEYRGFICLSQFGSGRPAGRQTLQLGGGQQS